MGRAGELGVTKGSAGEHCRPELEHVGTGTGSANSAMIRVNERLGFVTAREVVVVNRSP
ncbi:hypothetical protein [Lentzea sp. CC55]|uniref:hypothetical protein n=1 Tax=Lentzea sp. CC55 TaxID=2884909 RepID=UPI001F423D9B|nr:hypothetical protein [Lentzea sp. CC55]MCG8928335.1 hypothetical protein [Lentzea sp. CC55]